MGAAPLAVYVATWEKAPSVLLAKTLTSIPCLQYCFAYDSSRGQCQDAKMPKSKKSWVFHCAALSGRLLRRVSGRLRCREMLVDRITSCC